MTGVLVLGVSLVLTALTMLFIGSIATLVKAVQAHRDSVMLLAGATIRLTAATEASLKVAKDQIETNRRLLEAARRRPMHGAMH